MNGFPAKVPLALMSVTPGVNDEKTTSTGPLIAAVAGRLGAFPVPVVLVPGELSHGDLEALS